MVFGSSTRTRREQELGAPRGYFGPTSRSTERRFGDNPGGLGDGQSPRKYRVEFRWQHPGKATDSYVEQDLEVEESLADQLTACGEWKTRKTNDEEETIVVTRRGYMRGKNFEG